MAEIKYCGLTREEDAEFARQCGARYAGVIFARGHRAVTAERAACVLDALAGAGGTEGISRVGVFDAVSGRQLGSIARRVGLDIVQLHGDPDAAAVQEARAETGLPVWAAVRLSRAELPEGFPQLAEVADAIVLDARVAGQLGGTGVPLDWHALSNAFRAVRRPQKLVLAGGLTPGNVGAAIRALSPDVVDVASGVELLPGIKDHVRMRAFADAVHKAC